MLRRWHFNPDYERIRERLERNRKALIRAKEIWSGGPRTRLFRWSGAADNHLRVSRPHSSVG